MNHPSFRIGLLSAALLAAFGVARADSITTTSTPSEPAAPKCIDSANTVPAGCVPDASQSSPSAAATPSTSESRTLDVGPSIGADANAAVDSSSANPGADVNAGPASQDATSNPSSSSDSTQQPDAGSSSTQKLP